MCCIKRIKTEFLSSYTNLPQTNYKNRQRGKWLKFPRAEWWWTAYNQLLQYGFWLSVSGVRCPVTLNTLKTLPSAQMDISAVKDLLLWMQLFYNVTWKLNQRKWCWIIWFWTDVEVLSFFLLTHQGFKEQKGYKLQRTVILVGIAAEMPLALNEATHINLKYVAVRE